jgi:serine/threonine-protein kinase
LRTGAYESLGGDPIATAALREPPPVPGYEILGVLGRGGMGVVYKARHVRLKRLVALKMVLAGEHAGREERVRFGQEAEAVARLQHPGIVQIYEVGEHAGRPYFSLELVEGGSLARKLSGTPLPAREAAGLAEALAQAVHAAHRRGVVHRDLKPANVLLTPDGAPKIGDFGLAKQLDQDSGQTKSGAILGTPSYMAPEQARGEGHAVGLRTDVYALGAILYEMLTGRPPFRGTSVVETLEQIRSNEPVPPRQLQPAVPRDLETVCLKCLQKEPPKRYAGADALADDLRRFLGGEPIRARPAGAAERLWRWCRRNPRVAGLSAAVLALLVTVGVVSTAMAVRISQERAAAVAAGDLARQKAADEEAARTLADQHAENARQAQAAAVANAKLASEQRTLSLDTLHRVVTEVDETLRDRPDMLGLQQAVIKIAMAGLEKVSRTAENAASADSTVAIAFQRMGDIYLAVGQTPEGRKQYQLSLPIFERLMVSHPEDDWNRWNAAISYTQLGDISRQLGEPAAVVRAQYLKGLALREELVAQSRQGGPVGGPLPRKRALAISYAKVGSLAVTAGDPADGLDWYRKALALSHEISAAAPSNRQFRQSVAGSCLIVADVCFRLRDEAGARAHLGQALDLRKQLAAEDPHNVRLQGDVASAYGAAGDLDLQLGRPGRALELYQTAHAIHEELAKKNPENVAVFSALSSSFYRLGTARLYLKDGPGSDRDYRESLWLQERLAKADPSNTAHKAGVMLAQARCGRHAEAAAAAQELAQQGARDASRLFRAACGYALAVAGVAHGRSPAEVTPADREQQQRYAEAAISALTRAVAVGYNDVVALELDPDLLPLHAFPAYQELLAKVRAK